MMTEDQIFEAELEKTIREQEEAVNEEIKKMTQENKDIISEKEFNDVLNILEDNANNSEEIKTIREITESEQPEVLEDEEIVGTMKVDPATGINIPVGAEVEVKERPISEKSLTELADEYEPTTLPIHDEDIKKHFVDDMNISAEDAMQLIAVLHRHAAGERFSKFNALPKSVQDMIRTAGAQMGVTSPEQLRFFTNTMLDEFIQDAAFNKEIVDFEESIKKELNIPSIVDMHSEYIKDAMEKEMLERADKLEAEGKTDAAEKLRKVSAAFTSSYTYDKLYDIMEHNRKVRSRLVKDIDKYRRFCDDFIYKYRDTQFNIHDISLCLPILQRKFPYRTLNELTMFVNVMWKSMENLDIKDLEANIYAYYLIKNIMSLDYIEDSAKTEFTNLIMENIENVIDKINDYVVAKAEYDSQIERERKAKKGKKKNG